MDPIKHIRHELFSEAAFVSPFDNEQGVYWHIDPTIELGDFPSENNCGTDETSN